MYLYSITCSNEIDPFKDNFPIIECWLVDYRSVTHQFDRQPQIVKHKWEVKRSVLQGVPSLKSEKFNMAQQSTIT